jgi:DNA-binding response OmpR family regulator
MTASDPPLRVLLVEDDFDVAEGLGEYLARHRVEVDFAVTAGEALHITQGARFDVLVLDVQLPGEDGISLCRRLTAAHGGPLPVLFLTAMGSLDAKLAAFDAGALDYVVKPFEPAELLARLRAIVGRAGATAAPGPLVAAADFRLDPERHLLLHDDQHLGLTALSAKLLECLMRAYPGTVTRDALHEALWHGPPPDSDPLRTHVHQLRRQAEATFGSALIATVRGVGYRFAPAPEDADARPPA